MKWIPALQVKRNKNILRLSTGTSLKGGSVSVIPTDTMYGIVASAFDKKAVERIFDIKGRNTKKPLIVLISKIADLSKFGISPKKDFGEALAKIWPGKITVILPCRSAKFKYIHRGVGSIAFRIPNDKSLLKLLAKTGPLVAPSANPEGVSPATTISEANKYFGDKVDLYINGGKKSSKPSTIIKFQKDVWELVREGAVPFKKLCGILKI
ncbi:MAG: L-threonylcarbamoyladenylate synthase [Patescibacteria group bacterium]